MNVTLNTIIPFANVKDPLFTSVDCTYLPLPDTHRSLRKAIGIVDVHPINRAWIARYSDYIGNIPGIGSVIGILRLISGFALGIFYAIAKLCTTDENRKTYYSVMSSSSFSEAQRGIWEIFPFASLVCYMVCKFLDDYKNPMSPQVIGKINHFPHGNFIYSYYRENENKQKILEVLYGWREHRGTIIVLEKTDRPDAGEVEAILIDPSKLRLKTQVVSIP
jgi:hypothetical protein